LFNRAPESGFVPNLATPKPYIKITLADADALRFLRLPTVLKNEQDSLLQMIMQDSAGIRPTRLLLRGQYDQPGEVVEAGLPALILPPDPKWPQNRLGAAEWLFDPRHPLTARVMVNRFWQELFGRGIVATSDNFGLQGALPTHPALLDWLAVDFRENGWDMKRILRKMVTSATYRQSSVITQEALAKDPENRYLARGPRHRLHYEFIRDNALAAAGLLVRAIGGPPVRPYQPPGLWEALSTEKSANNYRGEYAYAPDTVPEKMYRRSIYTFNRRTIPPPTALSFDALPRDVCEVSRSRTSTPLQALTMLNDPQILEAARVLAGKILEQQGATDIQGPIANAFRQVLSRPAAKAELALLLDLYQSEQTKYSAAPEQARRLLQTGRYPPAPNVDPAAHAALTLVVSAIFNLDEALSKT
jgi:hypothetical protein